MLLCYLDKRTLLCSWRKTFPAVKIRKHRAYKINPGQESPKKALMVHSQIRSRFYFRKRRFILVKFELNKITPRRGKMNFLLLPKAISFYGYFLFPRPGLNRVNTRKTLNFVRLSEHFLCLLSVIYMLLHISVLQSVLQRNPHRKK